MRLGLLKVRGSPFLRAVAPEEESASSPDELITILGKPLQMITY